MQPTSADDIIRITLLPTSTTNPAIQCLYLGGVGYAALATHAYSIHYSLIHQISLDKAQNPIYNSASLTLLPFCSSQANNKLQPLHIVAQAMDLLAPFFLVCCREPKNYLNNPSHFSSSFPFTTTTTTNPFILSHQLFACANATSTTPVIPFIPLSDWLPLTHTPTTLVDTFYTHTTRLNPSSYCYPIDHPCDNNNFDHE